MVQKYTFQICQKLAIAAALTAALCCLPVAAQTSQVNETLILNDKPVTFADFLKIYPNQAERSKVLATLDEKSEDAFRDWEMAQLNKRSAEQDAEMAQLKKERAEQDVALKLSQEFGVVLDEIFKEQSAPKPATPEQQAINKKRAATIKAALEHPLVGGSKKYSPLSIRMLEGILKKLQTGENVNWTDEKMAKSLSDSIK